MTPDDSTSLTAKIASYQMDFGDNSTPYTGTTFDNVTHTYTTEGIYYPRITVTDSQGNAYSDTIVIVVLNRLNIDALLKGKWDGMKAKLVGQDVNRATSYLISTEKDRYTEIFNALGTRLQQITRDMQDIQLIQVNNNAAKYRIRKNTIVGGQTVSITYYIYFYVDKNGMWKINRF